MLRKLLDRFEPLFHKGGKFERLYPVYEAQDTFLYNTGEVVKGRTHVRDAIDTKRMMITVVIALIPCVLMACYNTGYQAGKILETSPAFVISDSAPPQGLPTGLAGWRYEVMNTLNLKYWDVGDFYKNLTAFDLTRIVSCVIFGLLYFLPVYIVTMAVGGACEALFSIIRRHEINEGFLVTGLLYPLTLPPNIPYWQVALGIMFGVVVGKEIFGGTGRNFLNPALTGRAFLYFAYPKQISGNSVWTGIDGYSGATALGKIAEPSSTGPVGETLATLYGPSSGATWSDFFWGNVHGSMGETSAFCCLLGAVILIMTRIGSWRIMAGVLIGMSAFSVLLWLLPKQETVWNILPHWHLVLGGFAFGTVFMATDPVSASMTNTGKWIYGGLIGFMTVLVRTVNPAFPEGIMLAILFANVLAPLIDYFVVQANVKRRALRYVA
ncbi:MAG TPA: NADH:ubiquinone reductase (Na(+)-transporting) subunit B [Pirellulaceae bacterium]|nr:NADH:ubiquinone reductase (Na(+)-transporting) subunit B [Pirellulaceae bacterium]HMO91962.1 NADH:ubiquinone reductase (Na(+)-transporting) subunit B [Pirellulaceae bacterium]HMP68761.1 NADH:ubiquinone reductase (Na(+)-transporting) subunit B [Pirellulaceae bacterium]